ncbi:MAG: hypothetical protein M3545_07575 [Acidobacteriota bacterium]|nr:hypothetical protein [Acidobacteriota bacterium]
MDVSELKGDMDRQFEGVARHFETIDQRFDAVDRRFEEMFALIASQKDETRRFILEEGERTRRYMLEESESTRRYMLEESDGTRRYMLEESESTRRHFDIVVEQVKSERNLALDKAIAADERTGRLTATNAADHVGFSSRLDEHELRLTRLERNEDS